MLIDRPQAIRRVADSFRVHPAVAIVGPRQCGKSTLARMLAANEQEVAFFDLERGGGPAPFAVSGTGSVPAHGLGGHRRGTTPTSAVRDFARVAGPARFASPLPAARQRFANPSPEHIGNAGWASGVGWICPASTSAKVCPDGGCAERRLAHSMATGRLSAQLSGAGRLRIGTLAGRLPAHVSGAGRPQLGISSPPMRCGGSGP